MSPNVHAERVHYGRGGAGNAGTRPKSPLIEPLATPTLKSKTFTTGRGGSGNMAHNDPQHPELARERQDVDIPAIKLVEGPAHTGRGGAANTYRPSASEAKLAKEHNDRIRSDSRNRGTSPIKAVRDMAEKGKGLFQGAKHH